MLVIRTGSWSDWIDFGQASIEAGVMLEAADLEKVAGVKVKLRTVSRMDYLETLAKFKAALESEGDYLHAATPAFREMAARGVGQVTGLVDEDGVPISVKAEGAEPMPDAALAVIEDAKMLEGLFLVARKYNELDAPEKKQFGQLVQSTSQTLTATVAPPSSKKSEGATVAA